MKGILSKTKDGWIVQYWEINPYQKGPAGQVLERVNELPLIDNGHIDGLKLYDSNEGLEVDFEIVANEGEPLGKGEQPYKQYAKLIPIDFQTKPGFVEKRMSQMLEHLASEEFKNVGDEGLFPNHTDKDIWIAGFKAGYLKK